MKSVQVRTRGEEGSEIGDFTAYVLYGYPLNVFLQNEKSEFFLLSEEKKTILELKISGNGINKGLGVNFAIILKNYRITTAKSV